MDGAGLTDDSTVVLDFSELRILVIAKPGDEHWTKITYDGYLGRTLSFAGRAYCATTDFVHWRPRQTSRHGWRRPPR